MNKEILNTGIQLFINNNLNTDISSLLLKGSDFKDVGTKEIAEQIEAKKRSEKKLPSWFTTEGIYYPNKLNIEQTSSEKTAAYKASLIEGKRILDLTGGFGVDSFYFANRFDEVHHCEINKNLSEIVSHNFSVMNKKNIITFAENGLDYLKKSNLHFDCIFVDPARRDDRKNKVFFLQDCTPDILEILPFLFSKTNCVMVKTSPLLDIKKGLEDLKNVNAVHVVAVNNEVKELLWLLYSDKIHSPAIHTINIKRETQELFRFDLIEETTAKSNFSLPQNYLYEPNSAILKSGGFNVLSEKLKLNKLHAHTHLYTSAEKMEFPGRRFEILKTVPYNKKLLKKELTEGKANITTRNFPETVSQIRKKTKIKEGGNLYLFFCTDSNNEKKVIFCKKI
ncbi:RsmD family RNA methyltransferase [Galbibacter sp. BG1]|uniref:class I SAM-dependent methyltransferase n=1 Tax=Galbibacter sp. BG1 TaxID=1170699 RepID=UPI0015BF8BA2|nr:class I SAM-dependent methyltransferase [Galbibacter sp. BG1]QLE03031.1 RsmD family RNA methyltransferase [Galbibacter sp. BG1]